MTAKLPVCSEGSDDTQAVLAENTIHGKPTTWVTQPPVYDFEEFNPRLSRERNLLRTLASAHILAVLLIVLSILVGLSTYSGTKWSRVGRPQTFHLLYKQHTANGTNSFSQLFGSDNTLVTPPLASHSSISVFTSDRERLRSKSEKDSLREYLICTDLEATSVSGLLERVSRRFDKAKPAFCPIWEQYLADDFVYEEFEDLGDLFAKERKARRLLQLPMSPKVDLHDYTVIPGLISRKCLLARDYGEKALAQRTRKDVAIPPITEKTRGALAPNYPGHALVENILIRRPLVVLSAIGVVWTHSLFLPQPLTMVHLPRLLLYLGLSMYRYFGLYIGLGWIEKRIVRRGFDFSDHIVLACNIVLIFSTEMVCMWAFRRSPHATTNSSHKPSLLLDPSPVGKPVPAPYSTEATEVPLSLPDRGRTSSLSGQPRTEATSTPATAASYSSSPISLEADYGVDSFYCLPRVVLVPLTCLSGLVSALMTYSLFGTAAFFHTPGESLAGLAVGLVGVFGLFWALLLGSGRMRCLFAF